MPRPRLSLPAVAIAGSLVVGAFIGLLLGGSSDPEPAGATVVDAGGLGVTMPPGWHAAHAAGSLSVQAEGASGASLHARLVDRPPVPQPGLEPVQLGTLQAWRASAPGVVRYAAPTTRGTVLITCQASPAAASSSLRECERTASTLTLHTGTPIPVTDAIEQEDRLRATVADLRAERESGRERLAQARRPSDQSATARVLALTHERAAAALDRVSGAGDVESAVRGAAAAYSDLAASAKSGSTERWNSARDRLRRSEASLAEALATGS